MKNLPARQRLGTHTGPRRRPRTAVPPSPAGPQNRAVPRAVRESPHRGGGGGKGVVPPLAQVRGSGGRNSLPALISKPAPPTPPRLPVQPWPCPSALPLAGRPATAPPGRPAPLCGCPSPPPPRRVRLREVARHGPERRCSNPVFVFRVCCVFFFCRRPASHVWLGSVPPGCPHRPAVPCCCCRGDPAA